MSTTASSKSKTDSDDSKSQSNQASNLKNSNKTVKEPTTMEELLAMDGVELRGLRKGDIVEGTISEIGPKSVFIDIGAKTEGMVIDREFSMAESYIQTLSIGDKVEAYVLTPENESGQIILSLRNAAAEYLWGMITEWQESGAVVTVKVKDVNRGGAIVGVVDELEGFIPSSQFTSELGDKLSELVGKNIEAKIIDALREEGKIILSEKAVSEAEDLAKKQEALALLDTNSIYNAVITRVVPFGVFATIDLDQLGKKNALEEEYAPEGLIHISELSWEKVDDPTQVAQIGDVVKIKVLEVDPKIGKLSLTLKRLSEDPWEKIEDRYPVDKQVSGVVTDILPFGVFVQLESGISGLIHISKLIGRTFEIGDKVECFVESIDVKGRRLSLGLVMTVKPVGYK